MSEDRPGDDIVWEPALGEEAQRDAAPVAEQLAYQPRKKWKPGLCVGFIINTSLPVARLKWPKKKDSKEFFRRINEAASLLKEGR